ncbi:MAG: VOC family protein [Kiloniellales bacterium]|nr:VOC family protein [Kiloniellales bacterium]
MELGAIEAVRVFTFDLARARAFYCETLGLAALSSGDGVVILDTGQAKLLIEAADPDDAEERPLVGRFMGISFTVEDAQRSADWLTGRGVALEAPPERQAWGGVLVHFRDPDGNILTLVEYP